MNEIVKNEKSEIQQYVELSCRLGQRFDLVQGKGGNSSVKLSSEIMLIKTSGFCLDQMTLSSGFMSVNYLQIQDFLKESILSGSLLSSILDKNEREKFANNKIRQFVLETSDSILRPSIESYLHAYFHKFTIHLHPIAVVALVSQKKWREEIKILFPDAMCVEYYTPGLELGLGLLQELGSYIDVKKQIPEIIFLQNHGLIVSASTTGRVESLVIEVLEKIQHQQLWSSLTWLTLVKMNEFIDDFSNGKMKSFACQNKTIIEIFQNRKDIFYLGPLAPDDFVFCGAYPVKMEGWSTSALIAYKDQFKQDPRILIFNELVFFIATDMKKAKEIEDAFMAHLLTLELILKTKELNDIHFLQDEEIYYLANWEAEKFRSEL